MKWYTKKFIWFFSLLIIVTTLDSCSHETNSFQGYFEGEYLYMAPSVSGHLTGLMVSRGQQISAKAPLFSVEDTDQIALVEQSQSKLYSAKSILNDMRLGKRKPELDVIKAQINEASSSKSLAAITLARDKEQFRIGAIAKAQLDTSITNYKVASDHLNELKHNLETALLPNRQDQIKAQDAEINYANAALNDSKWKLSQTKDMAPESALVYDTLYNAGELVSAGSPVVILLPPTNIKVRFFVPEEMLGKLKLGQLLSINYDGRESDIKARLTFVADNAEYTPPVIYSNETKNKLVFRAEAKPLMPDLLRMHPGQPVEVRLDETNK